MKKILLIIPAYNESEGIVDVVETVKQYQLNSPFPFDYIVINDGSTDNEEEVLQLHEINHVELICNLGIGGAVQTGYKYALEKGYDIAIQFDGDGQHDINSLPQLIEPILKGEADFTVGSRFVDESTSEFKSTGARQLGIKILSGLIKTVSGTKIYDVTSGFRAGNKKVIESFVRRYPRTYPEPESYIHLLNSGMKIKEIGVNMFERLSGTSSIKLLHSVNYMVTVSLSILIASLFERGEK